MGLIDGGDKNLDRAIAPSNPMLMPPLNNTSKLTYKYCYFNYNSIPIKECPMDFHDAHGYPRYPWIYPWTSISTASLKKYIEYAESEFHGFEFVICKFIVVI